jgi:hypothetical protein
MVMHAKPPMKRVAKIIADGPLSSRTKEYLAVEARLVAEARRRHTPAANGASTIERIRLEWTIWREVRAELKKKFPPGALYGTAPFTSRG